MVGRCAAAPSTQRRCRLVRCRERAAHCVVLKNFRAAAPVRWAQRCHALLPAEVMWLRRMPFADSGPLPEDERASARALASQAVAMPLVSSLLQGTGVTYPY